MKQKRKIWLLCLCGLALFTGCGNTNTAISSVANSVESAADSENPMLAADASESDDIQDAATDRDGFTEGVSNYTYDGLNIPIPDYYEGPTESDSAQVWKIEDGVEFSLGVMAEQEYLSEIASSEDLDQVNSALAEKVISDTGITKDQVKTSKKINVAGYDGMEMKIVAEKLSYDLEVYLTFVYNTPYRSIDIFLFTQRTSSSYDYYPDYERVINGVTTAAEQTISVTSSEEVTPELKEFLDSYEALVDQYVDFMKRYMADPTNIDLINEYSTYLNNLTQFSQKAEAYEADENNMSTADYNYFVDTYARITKKLFSVISN